MPWCRRVCQQILYLTIKYIYCDKRFRKKLYENYGIDIFCFCSLEVKNVFRIKLCLLYNNLALFNRSALDLETYSKFHM